MHIEAARENAENFGELAKEVEVFPRKVASALRAKAQSANIFEMIWNGLKQYVVLRVSLVLRLVLNCRCVFPIVGYVWRY